MPREDSRGRANKGPSVPSGGGGILHQAPQTGSGGAASHHRAAVMATASTSGQSGFGLGRKKKSPGLMDQISKFFGGDKKKRSKGSFRGHLASSPQQSSARRRPNENAVVHFFRTIVSSPPPKSRWRDVLGLASSSRAESTKSPVRRRRDQSTLSRLFSLVSAHSLLPPRLTLSLQLLPHKHSVLSVLLQTPVMLSSGIRRNQVPSTPKTLEHHLLRTRAQIHHRWAQRPKQGRNLCLWRTPLLRLNPLTQTSCSSDRQTPPSVLLSAGTPVFLLTIQLFSSFFTRFSKDLRL
ncbi:unnamed protein product [Menidia menidia]|uniref:Myelin basic protein n=1 Tax=Menidia menidia TaxID=238744 RepID=A0A8S4BFT4_9TELE|nr:unnamed protein product [Menidia menidia]